MLWGHKMPPTEGGEVGIWEAHIQALPRQREIYSCWKRYEMAWASVRPAWSFPMTLMVLALSLLYPQNDSATSGIKVMLAFCPLQHPVSISSAKSDILAHTKR